MSQLYLECTSGISGDMTVGALLDLGADRENLEKVLAAVPAEGWSVRISDVSRSGIRACDFAVILDDDHENHDHDMDYLYGPERPHREWDCPPPPPGAYGPEEHMPPRRGPRREWDCPPPPPGAYGPEEHMPPRRGPHREWNCPPPSPGAYGPEEHMPPRRGPRREWDCPPPPPGAYGPEECMPPRRGPHGEWDCPPQHHRHRGLKEVNEILDGTSMTGGARELAGKIFRIVAEAEAQVHGLPVEKVHFHEVGAIDSIVDIIAIAVCYDELKEKEGITEVIIPVLYDGVGTVRCQHGVLPVPVPAVTAIVRSSGIRMHLMPDRGEFVTPTGAAAAAALRTRDCLPEEFSILKTGLGAGKRQYPGHTGLLRAMLID